VASPYAGWKTYTLKYEKASLQYPSTDSSNQNGLTPNTDHITITGKNDYKVTIDDGGTPGGDALPLISSSPVQLKFLGQPAYLVYLHAMVNNPDGPSTPSDTLVSGAIVLTNPNNQESWPVDKNAFGDPNVNNGGDNMLIGIGYEGSSPKTFPSIAADQKDSQDKQARLILESIDY
jgi:hypothetical protein